MTDQTYPLDLLRAELKAALADQFVQLVDRFVSKADFQAHERDDEQHFREINQKLDALLTEKEQRDAVKVQQEKNFSARWVVLGVVALLLSSVLAAVVTLAAHAVWA